MWVMQVTVDDVIDVIPMRDSFVTATRAMDMSRLMASAGMVRRTSCGVRVVDVQAMLVHMVTMRVMQVTIMEIIDVIAMLDCGVSTVGSVLVIMVVMLVALIAHGSISHFTRFLVCF